MAEPSPTPLGASRPPVPLAGAVRVPGDKSISHRALMLGALAVGRTEITGLLEGEDVLATAAALRAMGAQIGRREDGVWLVDGVGVGGLAEPADVLDLGNSGTSARLLLGLLSTHPITSFVTGDASLRRRPMARVITPLSLFGARFVAREGGRLPLAVSGTAEPVPQTYRLPVPSAQVKSAVLLAGLNTPGETTVIEPQPTRDHTERMLRHFGATVVTEPAEAGGRRATLVGQPELVAAPITVPGDPSSAAFALVAALIVPGSAVTIENVGVNPLRAGLIECLEEMGADITLANRRETGGEPVVDLVVRAGDLKGADIPPQRAPRMIDEYPVLAVAAACARGRTVMRGLAELRVKESDRLSGIAAGLAACGVEVRVEGDDLIVEGRGGMPEGGALIGTQLDHRIAMAFLVLGLATRRPVRIDDSRPIATSFPDFLALMRRLGAAFGVSRAAFVVAIDGPAAAGKGTLARRLAERFGLLHLDTGALYRAAALLVLAAGGDPADPAAAAAAARRVTAPLLADPRLRDEPVARAASVVAAIPAVRAALLEFQRRFAAQPPGAVLDGRDIGSVVCPGADVKIFLDASPEARARRRVEELRERGMPAIYDAVLEDMRERDARDTERNAAPLKPAPGAHLIDTTTLDAEAVFERVADLIARALGASGLT